MKMRDLYPQIDQLYAPERGRSGTFELVKEGKRIDGRFKGNIRIDQPTYGAGQPHAHVYGRKGEEIGVLKMDGTRSHGSRRMGLHQNDAKALRARGFAVPADGIVEWVKVDARFILLEGQGAD